MNKKSGKPGNVAVPVLVAVPPGGGAGLAMSTFDRQTTGRPDDYQLKVTLAGGATVELIVWIKDDAGDWGRASDTGNLGMLGGQPLPTGATYIFAVNGIAAAKEIAIVAQNNNGPVVVSNTTLTPVVGGVEG